mgnify:CR=1 FL=1
MEEERLVDNARETGSYLMGQLKALQASCSHITDVRGRGLMVGIELDMPYKDVRNRLVYEEHVFTGCSGTNTLRLLPPLCFTKAMADEFVARLKKSASTHNDLHRRQAAPRQSPAWHKTSNREKTNS